MAKVRCSGSTKVVSLLIPKTRTRAAANDWARSHGYRATCKATGAGRFWHCRQAVAGPTRVVGTVRFGKSGILARMGCR